MRRRGPFCRRPNYRRPQHDRHEHKPHHREDRSGGVDRRAAGGNCEEEIRHRDELGEQQGRRLQQQRQGRARYQACRQHDTRAEVGLVGELEHDSEPRHEHRALDG